MAILEITASRRGSLTPSLQQLEAAQLIRALAELERAYFFRHVLVQESAYETLLKQERKHLHRAIAVALEQNANVAAEELARHFAAGEEPARAADYFARAGERARVRFANVEAIHFFYAALGQWEKIASAPRAARVELYEQLGDVLGLIGKHAEAVAQFDAGMELAEDTLTRARLIRKKGDVFQIQLQFELPRATYNAAEKELGALDATQSRARWEEWIWIQVGAMNNFYWHGFWEQVRALTERAEPFVKQYGTPALRAMYFDRVEMMLARRNRYVMDDETRELVVRMREAAEESQEARQILNARFSMAFVDLRRRDLEISESEFLWTIERAQELGDVLYELWARTYLAVLYRWRGDVTRTREMALASFQVASATGTPWYGAGVANLAWVALRENNFQETRRLAHEALKIWEPFGELYPFKTLALFPLLVIARRENSFAEAIKYAREILNPTQEKLAEELEGAVKRAVELFEANDLEGTRNELTRVVEVARGLGFV